MAAFAGGVVNRRPSRRASRRGQRLSPKRANSTLNWSIEIRMVAVRRNDPAELFHHGDTEAPRTDRRWKPGTHGSGAIRFESSAAGSRGYSKPSRSHLCSSAFIRGCSHAKRFGNAFGLQDHHIARGCTKLRRGKIRVPWCPFVVTPRLGGSAPCLPASHPFQRRDAALKKLRLQPCRAGT